MSSSLPIGHPAAQGDVCYARPRPLLLDPEEFDDPLRPARGILTAVALVTPFWTVVGGLAYWLLHR